LDPFLSGVAIGFAIAAPVGPIGVLCIRRSIAGGMRIGLVSGLGAATADALYAGIATFALAIATASVARVTTPLHLIGGAFLLWLGATTALRAAPAADAAEAAPRAYAGAFLSTFGLTAVNPATIVSFAAVVAGAAFGAHPPAGLAAVRLVAGVFAGSALWWLTLSAGVGIVRRGLTPPAVRAVNVVSGIVLAGFGVLAIAIR
jgi:threonine/homoserine/homoserine lactone efflux protein